MMMMMMMMNPRSSGVHKLGLTHDRNIISTGTTRSMLPNKWLRLDSWKCTVYLLPYIPLWLLFFYISHIVMYTVAVCSTVQ